MSIGNIVDESIYDEMDNLCSELLEGDGLVKYILAKEEALYNLEEATKKYIENEDEVKKILTFGDFYYRYLAKYSNCFEYVFTTKGYSKNFKDLLLKNEINADLLDINWESFEKKEEKYQELLVDILYAQINYELNKYNLAIFGLNLGYESVLYFVTSYEKYKRIKENEGIIKIFDTLFLETIYSEIYEITGNISSDLVEIGDFIEKRGNEFTTLFNDKYENTVLNNLDETNKRELKIIL